MQKFIFAICLCALFLIPVIFLLSGESEEGSSVVANDQLASNPDTPALIPPATVRSNQRPPADNLGSLSVPGGAQVNFDLVMSEVEVRLKEHQTDEALNELNAMLSDFDNLSDKEKGRVLVDYASYFSRLRQFDDAIFFYEAAVELPGLDQDNRLAILQLLARYAMNAEDWDAFLDYNDRYFAEGGVYNWIVTGHLLSAYQRLSDSEAAGQAFLLHLETGLDPQFDGSDEQYNRRYGSAQSLPLEMADSSASLALALGLVEEFDRIENWKVLADLHGKQGNTAAQQEVMQVARERGFLDADGEWLVAPD